MVSGIMIAGFTLGAVGSLHCVGMCGPLALALPVHHLPRAARFFSILFYQLGRILTYALLGFLFGSAGQRIYLAGFQQAFSMVMGILVIAILILYSIYHSNYRPAVLNRFFRYVQQIILRLLQSEKNIASFMLLGIANGFLPCGMVYVAIAAALTSASITDATLFMALFGAGTLPAMMTLSYFGQMVSLQVRKKMRQSVPVFIGLVGLILILRGLQLDIPYISPVLPGGGHKVIQCL